TYTVLLVNSFESAIYVDFVEISNDIGPLVEGFYQETYPTVTLGLVGAWIAENDKKFNGGTAVQSTALNDSLVFEFEGTGFEIGTSNDSDGGDMLVCYEAGSLS